MRDLIDTPAVRRRDDLAVVRVTGPDRLSYLHTLLSQQLADAAPGHCADFVHLDAKGAITGMGRAVVRAEEVWLVVPAPVAPDLTATLEKMKFLTEVDAVDASDDLVVASVRGPGAVDVPGARSQAMTVAPHQEGAVVRDRSGGADLIGPPEWVDPRVEDLGLPTVDAAAWDAWRIDAGEPAWGVEVVAGRRVQELGLLPTHVHLRKGCYPGQESVAKIWNLGRPRRALAVVDLDGPVGAGAPLDVGGKAGEVTSAAPSPAGTVALALVPVDRESGQVLGGPHLTAADGAVTGVVRHRIGEGLPQPGAA